jgi:hypothetical protein
VLAVPALDGVQELQLTVWLIDFDVVLVDDHTAFAGNHVHNTVCEFIQLLQLSKYQVLQEFKTQYHQAVQFQVSFQVQPSAVQFLVFDTQLTQLSSV